MNQINQQVADVATQQASSVTTVGSANVIAVGGLALLAKFGISSWAEAAGFLACILALTQLCILWWKLMWKPIFIKLGWIKVAEVVDTAVKSTG